MVVVLLNAGIGAQVPQPRARGDVLTAHAHALRNTAASRVLPLGRGRRGVGNGSRVVLVHGVQTHAHVAARARMVRVCVAAVRATPTGPGDLRQPGGP